MAALEGADDAIGFASGMGAISSAVLAFVEPGDRIVCVRHVYPDAYRLFETLLKRWRRRDDLCRRRRPDAVASGAAGREAPLSGEPDELDDGGARRRGARDARRRRTESSPSSTTPGRPRSSSAPSASASTSSCTPPRNISAATSDVVAGVVSGRRRPRRDDPPRRSLPYLGAKLAPFDAWLLLRGLRTLPTRMKAHEAARPRRRPTPRRACRASRASTIPASATRCRRASTARPACSRSRWPTAVDIVRFCDALDLFKLGVSWGGHESLVVPALVARGQAAGPNSALDFGVPERMVRLHVGLEGDGCAVRRPDRAFAAAA